MLIGCVDMIPSSTGRKGYTKLEGIKRQAMEQIKDRDQECDWAIYAD